MLYDPKWGRNRRARTRDIHSLQSLINWLEKQPADIVYDYGDTQECMLCQYFRAMKVNLFLVDKTYYKVWTMFGGTKSIPLPYCFDDISCGGIHTFGAALQRARYYQEIRAI
jgi:hypothetical protein